LGRWVHSHEEDTDAEMVFRPGDYSFPPSRGRQAFELRPDGTYVESGPGPVDRPEEATGEWDLAPDDTLVLTGGPEGRRSLRIESVDPDRLVVRK